MWVVYLIEFGILCLISFLWAYGIDDMNKKHPNYKGEDFLDRNNP